MSRPEHLAPPEIYYGEDVSRKYTTNTRMMDIQARMAERALNLLLLPDADPCLLLDIGCGSGISGECISERGYMWIGYDISQPMLSIAQEREIDGDLILADAGDGLRFKPGTFDGAISISALQWLCNADKKGHEPFRRLKTFFTALCACLKRGSRAVLQFYPETASQVEMITAAALVCGFGGGLVVDHPHSAKAKKHFLVIYAGWTPASLPPGLQGEEEEEEQEAVNVGSRDRFSKRGKKGMNRREWVLNKKEQQRKKDGFQVRTDTKYTARKRRNFGGF